jgi:DNA-binding NtrC family response regulator
MLLEERDYGELLASLLDATIEVLGAERGFIVVREEGELRAAVARNYRAESLHDAEREVSTTISTMALEQGRPFLLDDAQAAEGLGPSVRRLALRSVLCAPVGPSALVYLENRDLARRFGAGHRELLAEICALAGPRLRIALEMERVRRLTRDLGAEGMLSADPAMTKLLESVRQVAVTDLPVLIQGETGTGKELIARAVYRNSRRSHGPFVVVNCAAIPGNLIESELFGYVRGAFTGALRDKPGLVGAAHRGTLFLDEIGEMPVELQPRLLRVLQSGEFTRLGSVAPEIAEVRVIAATHRDLEREIEQGRFRQDLYYRLSPITLKIPPLRERRGDIPLLAGHFLRHYAARFARPAPQLTPECLAALEAWGFPGNVRELEGEMARLVAVSAPGAPLPPEALNERIRGLSRPSRPQLTPMSLADMERSLIETVLGSTGGNRTRAAEILGISREGLRMKMQRLGLGEVDEAPKRSGLD